MPDNDVTDDAIAHALGDELRLEREAQDLNRTEVVQRMDTGLSAQALANYEYGIRPCTVVKLVRISRALDIPATDLLGLALQRAKIDLYLNNLYVDLHALDTHLRVHMMTGEPHELAPLHQWARTRLRQATDNIGTVCLNPQVVEELACVVDMSLTAFIRAMLPYTPSRAPRWPLRSGRYANPRSDNEET